MATTQNTYTGDGTTVLFSFTFPYIEESDIKVSVDDVAQTVTTQYTLANATTVQFVTAPSSGAAIKIFRETDTEDIKSVFFAGSAIRARDLNDNFTQTLYVAQESAGIADSATASAAAAAAAAAAAEQDATQATSDAAAAQATATAAQSDATNAVNTANTANTTANTAVTTANSAVTTANAADTKADSALSSIGSVLPFSTVANVAAIPTSPTDGDVVRIVNSTGIESFTPLAGLPTGFVGDAGIYVQISYDSTATSWNYQTYQPNDPDSRYVLPADIPIQSVNGATGAVVLDTDDVAQGSVNLYSQWGTSGSNVSYLSGSVGIGTTTPQTTLEVAANDPKIRLNDLDGSARADLVGAGGNLGYYANGGGAHIWYGAADVERMRISPGGNIGIGSNAPIFPLVIEKDSGTTARFTNTGGTSAFLTLSGTTTTQAPGVGANGDSLVFNTGFTERLRITNTGNITINEDLHVGGAYTGSIAAVGASNTIDCSVSNYFTETVAGAVTFAFTNVPASRAYALTLEIVYTSGTITWPASVYWPGASAPTLTTGKTSLIILTTRDGGTTWRASALADYDA